MYFVPVNTSLVYCRRKAAYKVLREEKDEV